MNLVRIILNNVNFLDHSSESPTGSDGDLSPEPSEASESLRPGSAPVQSIRVGIPTWTRLVEDLFESPYVDLTQTCHFSWSQIQFSAADVS